MTFILLFIASICATGANCLMRKTLDYGASTKGYLCSYFTISFFAACLLNPIFTSGKAISPPMTAIGLVTGAMLFIMMILTGKALSSGPSGLTFAFQNCGAIFPSLFLALVFKAPFGFELTTGNIIGMLLVLGGLFWSAQVKDDQKISKKWMFFAASIFIAQSFILCVFQWKTLLFLEDAPSHYLLPFHLESHEDMWFTPALFLGALSLQWLYFFFSEKRLISKTELIGGSIGGLCNGLATYFLLTSTNMATPSQKILLYPLFAVLVIVGCHIYGSKVYKEAVNWKANICCISGILVSTLF